MSDSSQHPGEDHKVERFIGMVESFRFTDLIADALCEPRGQIPARRANEFRIRVNRVHDRTEPRETHGQPPITAADFEDPFAVPIRGAFERAYFILFRIDAE